MSWVKILLTPKYVVLTIIVSLAVVVFSAWLPNLHLIVDSLGRDTLDLHQKSKLLVGLLGSLRTNFTSVSLTVTFVTAILLGIQVSLVAYYLANSLKLQRSMGFSAFGMVSSVLGIGCASCGSIILTSLVGFSSTSLILRLLPFGGQELSFVGVTLLLYSLHLTIIKIKQPITCHIKETR